jgi:predicted acylesterase/phospholipase RssA
MMILKMARQSLEHDAVSPWSKNCGASAAGLALMLLLAGCAAASRRQAPLLAYRNAAPVGFAATLCISTKRIRSQPAPRRRCCGGGAGIAYGAGALVGWSRTGSRPEFQIVTGVSAGALLAPLVFLGPKWDATVVEIFSGATAGRLLQLRWTNALFGASVYRGQPLVELVNRYVNDELLRALAAESARGRLLLIVTTDLDHERTVIWDMGRIAIAGGDRGRRLFRDVLVASASVPGLFPPVLIRVQQGGVEFDEMHVDGGTTMPLFIAPSTATTAPEQIGGLQGARSMSWSTDSWAARPSQPQYEPSRSSDAE